ncbi:MAG: glycoside hydrolase family 3 N-terminal domain-containing protein [Anaerolineales bacterium]
MSVIFSKRVRKNNPAWRAWLVLLLLLTHLGLGSTSGQAAPPMQGSTPLAKALNLLEDLTPEERVGQLFLVTFSGAYAAQENQIYDLVANYHVGGVILRQDMDNFLDAPGTIAGLTSLTNALQEAETASSANERQDALSGEIYTPTYIPLLIGLLQEGDGYPNDQILEGLSPLPSAMAIGATWQPQFAHQAGELLGSELAAVGVNLLLGPSLDVLDSPNPQSLEDLGARSFGGDPFWVGQMGQAFIGGVHSGSDNRVAVIAKHLPGYGSTDRPAEDEVPTVRKSLTQLTQIELPPFFSVTGDAPSAAATADGMLLAHIRYQGFQGNIRATTRPISFDFQAFSQLMALPQFAQWRANGGVIVSDNLGTRAVRRNYDPSEQVFNSPLVARDAFLAGNDLLYLGNFLANNDADAYASIRKTAQFFAQKYREDQAFAQRVDESVTRILALKFKLYPSFTFRNVNPASDAAAALGQNNGLIFEVGRLAATLLSPSVEELDNLLPAPPGRFEQVVFFTDRIEARQCSQCETQDSLDVMALEDAALALYGPQAGNQISAPNLTSFTFAQLTRTLDETWPVGEDSISGALQRAEWVVFALGKQSNRPETAALRRLLSERPDLIQNKKVIVFAMNAPYYLDATDITKITAYYALYTKGQGVAQVAARLLFQEISAPGDSPVSIEGIGYDLIEATSPDETQTIPMRVERIFSLSIEEAIASQTVAPEVQVTLAPTATPVYRAGDLLSMQTGPILDHNGNIVPDNTPVTFNISIVTEGTTLTRQISATTRQGLAAGSYSIEEEGILDIIASSGDPAARSATLRFDVIGINPEGLALQATQTAQAELSATAAVQPTQGTVFVEPEPEPVRAGVVEWFLSTLVSALAGYFAYQAGSRLDRKRWAVRWGLTTLIGGLAVGSYLSFDLPGSQALLANGGTWGVVLSALAGAGLGWLAGWVWRESMGKRRAKPPVNDLPQQ